MTDRGRRSARIFSSWGNRVTVLQTAAIVPINDFQCSNDILNLRIAMSRTDFGLLLHPNGGNVGKGPSEIDGNMANGNAANSFRSCPTDWK